MSRENLEKEGITLLGNQKVKYSDNYAPEVLETFLNKHPDNDYFVKFKQARNTRTLSAQNGAWSFQLLCCLLLFALSIAQIRT